MSAQIEIDRSSFDALNKNLDDIKKKIPLASYQAMVAFLFNAKSLAQNRLKDHKHIVTSRLRNSIYVKSNSKLQDSKQYSDDNGKSYSAELETVALKDKEAAIGTNVEYAAAIERGAAPHTIYPRNGRALSWINKSTGERIFIGKVNHPGYAGDSFLWWAVQNADDKEFVKEYNRQVNDIKLRR